MPQELASRRKRVVHLLAFVSDELQAKGLQVWPTETDSILLPTETLPSGARLSSGCLLRPRRVLGRRVAESTRRHP